MKKLEPDEVMFLGLEPRVPCLYVHTRPCIKFTQPRELFEDSEIYYRAKTCKKVCSRFGRPVQFD